LPTPSILNIVLHQPEIPGNTGAIGRTCVALGAKLWLVRPLGFQIDEKTLRRAGLDYWQHLDWEVADHWDDLLDKLPPTRCWYFSRFATRSYTSVEYQRGDTLVFGSETTGLPKSIIDAASSQDSASPARSDSASGDSTALPDRLLKIPTTDLVRSLNLATSVGIAAFECARQFEGG
jgi:tRNA (cytidine/uridine-2'-O-)-methyltransferase